MKKIFLFIGFMFLCSTMFGQRISALDAVTSVTDDDLFMIRAGATGNKISKITWANILGDGVNLDSIAVMKHADTLLLTTATYRLKVADDGRTIRANRASQIKIYVPPDSTSAIPIGSVINVKMDNAGIVSFYEGTGIILESKNDSMSINVRHGWATLIKRTSLKWDLFGDLQD